MNVAKPLNRTTFDEFQQITKEEHVTYELIDGIVMMSPRPSIKHQQISGKLHMALWHILKKKNCTPILEADLIIQEQNFVPDLMIVCDEGLDDMTHYDKPPLIVVEIISPSSGSRDYFVKRRSYKEIGVQEYWIVSPEEKCIMVICFSSDEECRYCDGTVKSYIMPEIGIALEDIFA